MRLDHHNRSLLLSLIFSAIITTCSFTANADDVSLDLAISEYIKGFRACSEANNLRTSDLAQAKANFNYYTRQLSKAIAIDEALLQTNVREMQSNIKYCKRVEANLQREEATPLLEQGIGFCKSAKQAIINNELTTAEQEMGQYQQLKEQALLIAPDLMDVFALASKIRTCTRVEEKLTKAQNAAAQSAEEMKNAILAYQDFKAHCEIARNFINKPSFGIVKLQQANKLFKSAHKRKKAAHKNQKAFVLADEIPGSESAIALTSLIKDTRICENEVSSVIRRTTKAKRSHEKQLSNASKSLASANQECVEAQKQLALPVTPSELNQWKGVYNAAFDTRESIISNAALLTAGKKHKDWPQSRSLNQNLKNITSCLAILSATIKAVQPTTAPSPPNSASLAPLEQPASQLEPQQPSRTPNTTNNSATNEQDDEEFDEFEDFNKGSSKDKNSWTSIIDK